MAKKIEHSILGEYPEWLPNNPLGVETKRGYQRKYHRPSEVWDKAEEYFKSVTTASGITRGTTNGLFRHMGYSSKQMFLNLKNSTEEMDYVIDVIMSVLMEGYERNLHMYNWAGSAFALKNIDPVNWKDEQTVNQNVNNVVADFSQALPTAFKSTENTSGD